jgi:hypothetical protein
VLRAPLVALAFAVLVMASAPPPAAFAAGPCDAVASAPDPEPPPIDPYIKGTIYSSAATTGLPGATVRLFQCDGRVATEVGSTTTNDTGVYAFTDMASAAYFFVEVEMTGPLAGMSVVAGSANPTAAEAIGGSVSGLDVWFE